MFSFFSVFFLEYKSYAQDTGKPLHLIPWLTTNIKFGYADSSGKMFISPKFEDAQPFQNGYAVVGNNNKYGVINSSGIFVIPMKYAFARINSQGHFTLAILKKEYNAWWQFWRWKVLPEWSIFSRKSGPFLITKVPRAKWSIVSLPGRKTLFEQRRLDEKDAWGTSQYWKKDWQPDRTPSHDISISSTDSLISVVNNVFELRKNNQLKKINAHFICFTASNEIMVQTSGNRYKIITTKGKLASQTIYSKEDFLIVSDERNARISISVRNINIPAYPIIASLFKNSTGEYFLSPEFKTPFPSVITDYKSSADTMAASDILNQAVMICAIPNSTDFLIASDAGHGTSGGWNGFVLKYDGTWNTNIPLMRGIKEMLDDGRIVYDSNKNKGVLDTCSIFYSMPLEYISPCLNHHFWYMGKDTTSAKYGVFDVFKKQWRVTPKYNYLQDEIAPDVAIYSILKTDTAYTKKEWFGLINFNENKEITPPEYDRIALDGRVWKNVGGRILSFYINPKTGEEYRDK